MVHPKRHIAKTVTYRIVSSFFGFLFIVALTGSVFIGGTFSIVELIWKPLQYYIHERIWYKYIKFGIYFDKAEK
jgi:uncharacterized membrane protein